MCMFVCACVYVVVLIVTAQIEAKHAPGIREAEDNLAKQRAINEELLSRLAQWERGLRRLL